MRAAVQSIATDNARYPGAMRAHVAAKLRQGGSARKEIAISVAFGENPCPITLHAFLPPKNPPWRFEMRLGMTSKRHLGRC